MKQISQQNQHVQADIALCFDKVLGYNMEKQKFLIKSNLFERGWTSGMVNKFLPNPDQLKPNPHYKKSPPMKLYSLEKVEQVEITDLFRIAKEKADKRREAAQKSIVTKVAKTMSYVEQEVEVKVPYMKKESLIEAACNSYNDWKSWHENWDGDLATKKSDSLFLQRICVNYLRHEMTEYDYYLNEVHGKVGIDNAYFAIREKVFAAISEMYPWLAAECKRQNN